MRNIKVITIAGTRPEIVKLARLVPLLNQNFDHNFLYTGQHYSSNMKDVFIDELNLQPHYDFKSNTSDITVLRDNMLPTIQWLNPEYVIVYGDTNSSMAAALAAKKIDSKIIHLESGVRDFDYSVPEEPLRIQIDEWARYLFAPSAFCETVLSYENVTGKIYNKGNLIVDVCKELSSVANKYPLSEGLPLEFLLLTIHRPENADDKANLTYLMEHFKNIEYNILFPVHPRTRNNLQKYDIPIPSNIILMEPVGYVEFLSLLTKCKLVLTDSGGVQEEAITLKKPCITLRHTSARWETILMKANILFPPDSKDELNNIIKLMLDVKIDKNPYGDNVAKKTLDALKDIIV